MKELVPYNVKRFLGSCEFSIDINLKNAITDQSIYDEISKNKDFREVETVVMKLIWGEYMLVSVPEYMNKFFGAITTSIEAYVNNANIGDQLESATEEKKEVPKDERSEDDGRIDIGDVLKNPTKYYGEKPKMKSKKWDDHTIIYISGSMETGFDDNGEIADESLPTIAMSLYPDRLDDSNDIWMDMIDHMNSVINDFEFNEIAECVVEVVKKGTDTFATKEELNQVMEELLYRPEFGLGVFGENDLHYGEEKTKIERLIENIEKVVKENNLDPKTTNVFGFDYFKYEKGIYDGLSISIGYHNEKMYYIEGFEQAEPEYPKVMNFEFDFADTVEEVLKELRKVGHQDIDIVYSSDQSSDDTNYCSGDVKMMELYTDGRGEAYSEDYEKFDWALEQYNIKLTKCVVID